MKLRRRLSFQLLIFSSEFLSGTVIMFEKWHRNNIRRMLSFIWPDRVYTVFKPILVITLKVITACFSDYKYSEALYSSGSDVSVHWSSRFSAVLSGEERTVPIQFPQSIG